MPFVPRDAAIAVMVDRGKPLRGPVIELVLALLPVKLRITGSRPCGADAHFVAAQYSVLVPVVNGERPVAPGPFRAADLAIVVAIHCREADRRAAAALCSRQVRHARRER